MTTRIDYDEVAELYDGQPYRGKGVDPRLADFIGERAGAPLRVLDLACGTGNQIVANRTAFPDCEFVGVDASEGMLNVARRKAADVRWVHASADALPLGDDDFDFATCQFAYHHFSDREASFAEVFRVLRPGGRFVLTNVAPDEYAGAAFYQAFPAALTLDRQHFLPTTKLREILADCGFDVADVQRRAASEAKTYGELLDYVSVRTNNSHLTAMADDDYASGLDQIRRWIAASGPDTRTENPVLIVTFVANKP